MTTIAGTSIFIFSPMGPASSRIMSERNVTAMIRVLDESRVQVVTSIPQDWNRRHDGPELCHGDWLGATGAAWGCGAVRHALQVIGTLPVRPLFQLPPCSPKRQEAYGVYGALHLCKTAEAWRVGIHATIVMWDGDRSSIRPLSAISTLPVPGVQRQSPELEVPRCPYRSNGTATPARGGILVQDECSRLEAALTRNGVKRSQRVLIVPL